MKVTVCDACRKVGILQETSRYLTVKHHPELRLDLCGKHMEQIKKDHPRVDEEFKRKVFELKA